MAKRNNANGGDQGQANAAAADALGDLIKGLLKEHEDKILGLPDFKAPESREQAVALLEKIGVKVELPAPPTGGDPAIPPAAEAGPLVLTREGVQLAFATAGEGAVVEMSRDRHSWT